MIDIQQLTVRFGGVTSLDRATLLLDAGISGVIGPNGAGKTTLFNVLSGFVTPVSGSVRVDGEDMADRSAPRRSRWGIRRTFQQARVIETLTIGENIQIAFDHFSGRGRRLREIGTMLGKVGLDHSQLSPVSVLTSAERRLLEIARSLVGTPRLLLLDEPGAGMDESETRTLVDLIRRIPADFGTQVILVDHDMALVESTCEQLAVLDFGRTISVGACRAVLEDPVVRRAYLGEDSPPLGAA